MIACLFVFLCPEVERDNIKKFIYYTKNTHVAIYQKVKQPSELTHVRLRRLRK